MKPSKNWPSDDPKLKQFLIELQAMLTNGLTFNDNMLAALVEYTLADDGIVSGTELQRANPRKFKPVGFFPLSAVDSAGAGLGIASWAFNPAPTNGEGWYGVTITTTSGTIDKVRGVLVGG